MLLMKRGGSNQAGKVTRDLGGQQAGGPAHPSLSSVLTGQRRLGASPMHLKAVQLLRYISLLSARPLLTSAISLQTWAQCTGINTH